MDIPSPHEVHEMLANTTISFNTIHCNICNEQLAPFTAHSCAPYLKDLITELETRLKAAEKKLYQLEQKMWLQEGDGR